MRSYTGWVSLRIDSSETGNADEGAQVRVLFAGTNDEAPIFEDSTGLIPITQPLTTNLFNGLIESNPGRFVFFAADGDYDIKINEDLGVTKTTTIPAVEIKRKDTYNLTLAEMITAKYLKVGDVVIVTDRDDARGDIVTGETSNNFDIVELAGAMQWKVRFTGIVNIFDVGFKSGSGASASNNKLSFDAALAVSDVVRVPFVDDVLNVTSDINVKNGKRIIFDSEYMGEPLLSDPDRGIIGDGLGVVFTTDTYPVGSNTNRQIRIDNARIRNTNFPCLALEHSDDAVLNNCIMITSESEALKMRFSARVNIQGGHYLSTFSVKETETNFAITVYDNCNAFHISSTTVISGGANGGGVDVTKCQRFTVDGIYEVCGGYGQRIGGFSGNPNNLFTPFTFYKRGTEVKNTTNGWAAINDFTSGATFNAADWELINGNCNGVSVGGYFEQVQRPISLGMNALTLGVQQKYTYVGNSSLPANGVPAPDFCIEFGRVVGFGCVGGISYHKEGTEPTFSFEQPTVGGTFTDRLVDSTLIGHHVQGGGPDLLNNQANVDQLGFIFGLNQIKLTSGIATSGDRQIYISDTITANVGTGNDALIFDTKNGGVIDSIEIIEKIGIITSTLRVGSTLDTAYNANVDPETLAYSNNAALAPILSNLIRINTQEIIRVVLGVGTGTFRVKITYRL